MKLLILKKFIFLLSFVFLSLSLGGKNLVPKSSGQIAEHTYYTLCYSEQHEQAIWVYYKLTPELVNGSEKRTDDFRPDPKVSTGSATLTDYKGSGYHRGHLCPAGSMDMNRTSMSESFFLSNMSPQAPSFNTGRWKMLESQVRKWTNQYQNLVVATGPVFKDNIGHIGTNQVTVPGYYYKVVYCPSKQKMIAFVMPNKKLFQPIAAYVKTVDQVEALTGIDFFQGMEDSLEDKLEATSDISAWEFSSSQRKPAATKSTTASTQCKGIAKSTGKRCKQKTRNNIGYCRYHQKQAKKH
ncbi:endonuclease G [Saccharicrinis carchari]|uniref:Endonuclease G n=1 Tax=Saccharicrinis carchari TaxID=1168039 RepID=A0A521EZ91_SACCC|nr:DNA/RNA non-specific endonuclease [Saccharicrinis carchari]SMO89187.1 endonuclease G [Saccharicrinis carchari]